MIGRFLEISLPAEPVLDAVQFYERLGFQQAHTADFWSHHYGVVSDGRFHLGLHGDRVHAPTLSWVREDIAGLAREISATDIAINEALLEDHGLHELALDDPDGIGIRALEAQSFSPVGEQDHPHPLGWFRELQIRVGDLDRSEAFWEQLGLLRCGRGTRPTARSSLSCDGLNLMLIQDRDAEPIAAVFEHRDLDGLIAELARRDMQPGDVRRTAHGTTSMTLRSPNGFSLIVEQLTT
jgi:catechol 2,3-dioxygenase-like lactoylglutathione lyase family enzyme